jgi:hypothetical protein
MVCLWKAYHVMTWQIWYVLSYLINPKNLWIDLIMSTSLNHMSSLTNDQCDKTAQDRSFNCKWQLKASKEDCPQPPIPIGYCISQSRSIFITQNWDRCVTETSTEDKSQKLYIKSWFYTDLWTDMTGKQRLCATFHS